MAGHFNHLASPGGCLGLLPNCDVCAENVPQNVEISVKDKRLNIHILKQVAAAIF